MKFQDAPRDAEGWEALSSEWHYQGPHLSVATAEVRSPNKPQGQPWTIVHRKAAVIIAALTSEGKLVLIREERVPVQEALWSVPAGQIDDTHALAAPEMEEVARRELQEETGYEVAGNGQLLSLGDYFTSPGFTDERGYFFLAQPVEPGAAGSAHTDSESILDCRAFTSAEIRQMIANNEIRDANTLAVCAKLSVRGLLSLGQ